LKRLLLVLAVLGTGMPLSGLAATRSVEIPVSATQRAALGITVAQAQAVEQAPVASLPAVVKAVGLGSSAVVVPLAGTVTQLLAQDGQAVKPGQPLLQLSSREFLEQRAEAIAAASEARVLAAQVKRDTALVEEGIVPERRLQESKAALRSARAAAAAHSTLLRSVRGANGTSGDYQLLASASGSVAETGLSVGDRVEAGQVAFYLQRGDQVWLEAQLPERLMEQVAVGYTVTAGMPARAGRVLAVGRSVAPTTRGVLLRASLPAGPGLRPGQSTELTVHAPVSAGTVLVPASAVVRLQGNDTVFLATVKGFRAVVVQAGLRTASGTAVVGPGLLGGQVAVSGVGALKSMALAAAEPAGAVKEP
jgi:cobalt-zinc-cadmium efflux system membrane fusion protein